MEPPPSGERDRQADAVAWLSDLLADAPAGPLVELGADGVVATTAARLGRHGVVLARGPRDERAARLTRDAEPPAVAALLEVRALQGANGAEANADDASGDEAAGTEDRWAAALSDLSPAVLALHGIELSAAQLHALRALLPPTSRLALVGGAPEAHLALAERARVVASAAVAHEPATAVEAGGDPDPASLSTVARTLAAASAHGRAEALAARAALEQQQVDAHDHRWVVPEAQRRVGEAKRRAREARQRAKRAERAAAADRRKLREAREQRDAARAARDRERSRRERAEERLAALRQRRWWRLGQVLGAARRRPRLLLRLPVDVVRVVRGR